MPELVQDEIRLLRENKLGSKNPNTKIKTMLALSVTEELTYRSRQRTDVLQRHVRF